MNNDEVTFSFGKNWTDFLGSVSEKEIQSAANDIKQWLSEEAVVGKTVLDIGSGSGIHSLAIHLMGAKELTSVDVDPHSVFATTKNWENAGKPENWKVVEGSILDDEFVATLPQTDLVYSWGVLHHTGNMWKAIENASKLVKPNGLFWITIYAKGDLYESDLALKKRYNAASDFGKKMMVSKAVARIMWTRLKHLKNPFAWNEKRERGMNTYHDLIDWLGGLPYEVASEDEMVQFGTKHGFILRRIQPSDQRGCSSFVFQKT